MSCASNRQLHSQSNKQVTCMPGCCAGEQCLPTPFQLLVLRACDNAAPQEPTFKGTGEANTASQSRGVTWNSTWSNRNVRSKAGSADT